MKFIKIILLSFFLLTNLLSKEEKTYKYGFVYNYDILADYKEARDSLKKWIENLAKNKNVNLEVVFYENNEVAYKDFLDKKLDLVIVSHDFFFDNENEIRRVANNFWSISFNEDQDSRYCVLKRNDIKFNSYKDLRNKRVSVKQTNGISYFYLDKESLEANHMPFEKVASKVDFQSKESTLVLNVFFNKSDISVVREDTWTTMQELNPSIKKYVSLYECSDTRFSAFIGLFSKDTPNEHVDTFFDLANRLKSFKDSAQLFAILNFNKIYHLESAKIEEMKKFYVDYKILKEKYK